MHWAAWKSYPLRARAAEVLFVGRREAVQEPFPENFIASGTICQSRGSKRLRSIGRLWGALPDSESFIFVRKAAQSGSFLLFRCALMLFQCSFVLFRCSFLLSDSGAKKSSKGAKKRTKGA